MTGDAPWTAWGLWMAAAGVIVLVAAALLITIWLTARRIVTEATRALRAAEAIEANTRVIWNLQTSNVVAEKLRDTVREIEAKASALVDALHGRRSGGPS